MCCCLWENVIADSSSFFCFVLFCFVLFFEALCILFQFRVVRGEPNSRKHNLTGMQTQISLLLGVIKLIGSLSYSVLQ